MDERKYAADRATRALLGPTEQLVQPGRAASSSQQTRDPLCVFIAGSGGSRKGEDALHGATLPKHSPVHASRRAVLQEAVLVTGAS